MTYGLNADDRLQILLKAPLPPAQSAKCATELAVLMEVVKDFIASAGNLKPILIEDGIQIMSSNSISHRQPFGGLHFRCSVTHRKKNQIQSLKSLSSHSTDIKSR